MIAEVLPRFPALRIVELTLVGITDMRAISSQLPSCSAPACAGIDIRRNAVGAAGKKELHQLRVQRPQLIVQY